MENNLYKLLQDWHCLYKDGIISESEFNIKKAELFTFQKNEKLKIEIDKHLSSNSKIENALSKNQTTQSEFEKEKAYQNLFAEKSWFQKTKYWLYALFIIVVLVLVIWSFNSKTTSKIAEQQSSNQANIDTNNNLVLNNKQLDINQSTIKYFVLAEKTFFYTDADENTKRKAYLEKSQVVFGCCKKNGFVNCQFTNEKGNVTSGWIKVNELSTDYNVTRNDNNLNKAYVSLQDSTIYLTSNIRQDHRIFGYSKPDTTSEKLLLLSVLTNEVENNPFHCKLGSYYDTNGMDNMTLKFLGMSGEFVKAMASDKLNNLTILYFEKKWIEFDN